MEVTPIRMTFHSEISEECIGERQLWTAVLTFAIQEWRGGNLRQRREAQKFLFEDAANFSRVCAGAGLDPDSLRSKLLKIGHKIAMEGSFVQPLAA